MDDDGGTILDRGLNSVPQLISDARAGDASAFAELYAGHVDQVRSYARRLVPAAAVEDVVAEAFASTWEQLVAGGGPQFAFMGYLRATVMHLHLGQLRRDRLLTWVADIDDAAMANPQLAARIAEESPEHLVLEQLLNARMKEALATLPDRWQLIIVMVYVEGRPYAQIASQLDLSVGATRQLARRAWVGLRAAIGGPNRSPSELTVQA